MASLGWVSPGAATEGVTAIFFLKKWRPFLVITVCQFCGVTLILLKRLTTFLLITSTLIDFTRCHPSRVSPAPFYLSDLVCPLFFVNLPTIFFPSGVTPWRMSPESVAPPSDATEDSGTKIDEIWRYYQKTVRCLTIIRGSSHK